MEKKQVLLSDFMNKHIAINCETEGEAKNLFKQLHNKGVKWAHGQKLDEDTKWDYEKQNTCYATNPFGIVTGNKNGAVRISYTIYKYADIILVDDVSNQNQNLAEKAINIMLEKSELFELDTEYTVIMEALAKLLRYEDKEKLANNKNK